MGRPVTKVGRPEAAGEDSNSGGEASDFGAVRPVTQVTRPVPEGGE